VTSEERERIRAAARRYVREQAPTPPVAVLECVARIVLQAGTPQRAGDGLSDRSHPASTRGSVTYAHTASACDTDT
jgi:hypothetical protein